MTRTLTLTYGELSFEVDVFTEPKDPSCGLFYDEHTVEEIRCDQGWEVADFIWDRKEKDRTFRTWLEEEIEEAIASMEEAEKVEKKLAEKEVPPLFKVGRVVVPCQNTIFVDGKPCGDA